MSTLLSRRLQIASLNPQTTWLRILPTLRVFSVSHTSGITKADIDKARNWLKLFNESTIPTSVGDVSYSRSSGPGGQNVNKVNSKAQLKVPLNRILPIVPSALHSALRASRYYANKTDSLLLQADDSRKQATNKDSCWRKLCEEIQVLGKEVIPGETSKEQKEKVKNLKVLDNEARLQSKKQHSGRKASRSKSFADT